jgi:uracil-DNA glycosylase
VNRCAPPGNKPTPTERDNCLVYLRRELEALGDLRVIVARGSFAWDGALRALASIGQVVSPKPRFAHAAEAEVGSHLLLGCFHPSQQNTFTGKLTLEMLVSVFRRAARLAG